MSQNTIEQKRFAVEMRIKVLEQLYKRGFGHIGGAMSIADLLSVLYNGAMKYDPANPNWEERDFLLCSKGHAGPALYATLALKGFFPLEWLMTLNNGGTRLPSHCDHRLTPGIDFSTGSLGQGLSIAAGVAKALKLNGKPNNVFCIVGDGEMNEGQVWEALAFIPQQKLNNLILFIDNNLKQIDNYCKEIIDLSDFETKLDAFKWFMQSIPGNDVEAIEGAIANARKSDRPSAIVLNTVKGKGVPCVETMLLNHHIGITKEIYDDGMAALTKVRAELEKEVC